VLEIGTGTGSLTALIAAEAGAVISVELDPRLHQLALEELSETPNVTLLKQDALKSKNKIDPHVLKLVEEQLALIPGSRLKLVANLPYNIATPVLANLLNIPAYQHDAQASVPLLPESQRPPYQHDAQASVPLLPVSMTVTIQKEVAQRILASPSSKDYGALSIWIQSQCEVELIRELPPTVFWPRPKVSSAIIQLRPQPALRKAIGDLDFFHSFVRAIFCHRRKLLRSELITSFKQLSKQQIDEILLEQGFAADARAEQLSWQQMLSLSVAVKQRLP